MGPLDRLARLASPSHGRTAQAAMGTLWVVFLAGYVGFFYVYHDAREIADADLDGYLEVVLLGVPIVVLFGVLVWMSETEVDVDLHRRVVGWTVAAGGLLLAAMHASLFVLEPTYDRGEQLLLLLLGAGFGASMGAVTGMIETRSIHRGRERERSAMEARRREREQRRLEHLNQYLRHEVLNDINKIHGYARLLQQERSHDDAAAEWVEIVATQSEQVAEFVSSIRSLLAAGDHEPDLEPVDVRGLVREIADRIRRSHPRVSVTIDASEPAWAAAGDMLERVFSNLLYNAIEHGGDEPMIRIELRSDSEEVCVLIHDDGPGIPEGKRDTLFEPPDGGDHGYGLFLMQNIAELYGGRLELAHTGPDGSSFRVRFPATNPPADTLDPAPSRSTAAC